VYDGSDRISKSRFNGRTDYWKNQNSSLDAVHPDTWMLCTHNVSTCGIEFQRVGFDAARRDTDRFNRRSDEKTAAVVVQSPNFLGCIENISALADRAHALGALLIIVVTEGHFAGNASCPGCLWADIVVAKGQSFGIPLSFGGPLLGLLPPRTNTQGKIPGRLVGEAFDKQGRADLY